ARWYEMKVTESLKLTAVTSIPPTITGAQLVQNKVSHSPRPEYLRKPTVTDTEKLYWHHEEKNGFPGMLGSLDCMDWEWFGYPYGFRGQYLRHDHSSNPFILLEAVASHDLWIWHAFFKISFVPNGVTYPWGYYLVDEIYRELVTLVKTIPKPVDDDHKQILYKQKHESARKDVE
ncbi:ALP1-like protein isoform X1, partial [Tanacetum coccineum]